MVRFNPLVDAGGHSRLPSQSSDFNVSTEYRPVEAKPVRQANEGLWHKYNSIPGLLLNTALSIALLILRLQGWTSSYEFADKVARNPSSVGIVVQILSAILGAFQIYALGKTINLSARYHFARKPFSLDFVKFTNALYGTRCDWTLPSLYLIPALSFVLLAFLPSALWAGAITPVIATKTTSNVLPVQAYKDLSWLQSSGLGGDSKKAPPSTKNGAQGIFTFTPQDDLQGFILNSASGASARADNGTVVHAKLDKTKYDYFNRSYGVGAAVGLLDEAFTSQRATFYSYSESGFLTDTKCIYNKTSNWKLSPSAGQPDGWLLKVFEVIGSLPNEPHHVNDYVAATFSASQAIVAINTNSVNDSHMLSMTTTGPEYVGLNQTQCTIAFTPTNFTVGVNVVNKTINVTPQATAPNFLHNDSIANSYASRVVQTIYDISQSLSTALYVNPIGNAMIDNIYNVRAAVANNSFDGDFESTNLTAIQNVFTSIIDDTLVALSEAQLMLLNDTQPTPVSANSTAYSFGTAAYIYPVVVLNFVICVIYAFEALRTRGWRNISLWDPIDVKSAVVGASEGGSGLAAAAHARHGGGAWVADSGDEVVGEIRVRLENGRVIRLAAAERGGLGVAGDGVGGFHTHTRGRGSSVASSSYRKVGEEDEESWRAEDDVPLREFAAPVGMR